MENPEIVPENKLTTFINNKCQTCRNYKCICETKKKIADIKKIVNDKAINKK
jgi:hypothetical protein